MIGYTINLIKYILLILKSDIGEFFENLPPAKWVPDLSRGLILNMSHRKNKFQSINQSVLTHSLEVTALDHMLHIRQFPVRKFFLTKFGSLPRSVFRRNSSAVLS